MQLLKAKDSQILQNKRRFFKSEVQFVLQKENEDNSRLIENPHKIAQLLYVVFNVNKNDIQKLNATKKAAEFARYKFLYILLDILRRFKNLPQKLTKRISNIKRIVLLISVGKVLNMCLTSVQVSNLRTSVLVMSGADKLKEHNVPFMNIYET